VDNFSDAPNRKPVRLIVAVARVAGAAVEVQVVTIRCANLRTAPIVAVAALIVDSAIGAIAVAHGWKEQRVALKVAAVK